MPKYSLRSVRTRINGSIPPPQSLEEQAQLFVPGNEPEADVSFDTELFNAQLSPKPNLTFRVVTLAIILVTLVETGALTGNAPSIRICEEIACRQYYLKIDPLLSDPSQSLPEAKCKIEEVQSEVAFVRGWQDGFDSVIGAAMALPVGVLADSRGRRLALMIVVPGILFYGVWTMCVLSFPKIFPLRTLWISSAFFFLGGGPTTLSAVIWTMLADVVHESQRAKMFFRIGVAIMVSEIFSSSISGFLMRKSPYLALYIGWGIVIFGLLFVFAFPETLPASERKQGFIRLHDLEPNVHEHADDEVSPTSQPSRNPFEERYKTGLRDQLLACLSDIKGVLISDTRVGALLGTFVMFRVSRGAGSLFLQYVSTRYGWPISSVTFLISLRAAVNILHFLVLLPAFSTLLIKKFHVGEAAKDLVSARVSAIVLCVGSIGIGLSPHIALFIVNMIIFTLGSGFAFLVRSVVTSMVPQTKVAKLYTAITFIEALGGIIASPLSAWLFQLGMQAGTNWAGLPFLVTAVMFGVIAMIVWFIRVPEGREG